MSRSPSEVVIWAAFHRWANEGYVQFCLDHGRPVTTQRAGDSETRVAEDGAYCIATSSNWHGWHPPEDFAERSKLQREYHAARIDELGLHFFLLKNAFQGNFDQVYTDRFGKEHRVPREYVWDQDVEDVLGEHPKVERQTQYGMVACPKAGLKHVKGLVDRSRAMLLALESEWTESAEGKAEAATLKAIEVYGRKEAARRRKQESEEATYSESIDAITL